MQYHYVDMNATEIDKLENFPGDNAPPGAIGGKKKEMKSIGISSSGRKEAKAIGKMLGSILNARKIAAGD